VPDDPCVLLSMGGGEVRVSRTMVFSVPGTISINTCTEQVMLADHVRCTSAHNEEISVKSH
jgi:hypothetical protein